MNGFDYHGFNIASSYILPILLGMYLFAMKNSTNGKIIGVIASVVSAIFFGISIHALIHGAELKKTTLIVPMLLSSANVGFIVMHWLSSIPEVWKDWFINFGSGLSNVLKGIIDGELMPGVWHKIGQISGYVCIFSGILAGLYVFGEFGLSKGGTENNIKLGTSLAFIFFMCIVSIGLLKSEIENKYTLKLASIILHRKNITWTVFFVSFLSFGIPFLINNRNEVNKKEEEDLNKCMLGGGDTESGILCKDNVIIESNKKITGVEYPFYIILFIMISLLMGINMGKIKEKFYNDQTKGLITLFCLGTLMSFMMYQIDREKMINVYTEEERKQEKSGYLIGNIIFLILGFIGFFSLIIVQNNPVDRPDLNNLKENMFWLFEKIKSDLLSSALYFGGLFAFVSFFLIILNKKSLEMGITGNIVQLIFLMIGLSLIVMLYKFLISSEIMKKFPVIKILLNLIFFIPCILFGIVEFLYNDFTNTPKVVYVLLLGQIILISSYILIPLIVKNLFGLVKIKKNSGELNNLKKKTSEKNVSQKQEEMNELKNVVSEKVTENMWNKIIGEKIYNDINELHNYLKISTNIQDRRFYVNKDVADKTRHEIEILEKDEIGNDILTKMKEKIKKEEWSKNCNVNFNTCNTKDKHIIKNPTKDLSCNLANYTIYIHLVGDKISKAMDELTELELKKKKATEKDEKYFDTNTQLVSNPIYLDRKTETDKTFQNLEDCGSYDFNGNFINDVSDCNKSYNYGLSLWVNLHAQPPNKNANYSKYTTIINYANNPKISYNMKENKLKVEILRNGGEQKEMFPIFDKNVLKLQKWNNIVVNYNLGIVEIFVNSKLVVSVDVVLPYIKSDKIVIGEKNGISGGICNVVYYPTKLTKTEISLLYNSLKLRNPPIV